MTGLLATAGKSRRASERPRRIWLPVRPLGAALGRRWDLPIPPLPPLAPTL
jgi:hypothetical protein